MSDDLKTRKLQVALYTRGMGAIIFGLWSVIKTFLVVLVSFNFKAVVQDIDSEYRWIVYTFLFVLIFLFSGGIAYLHVLVGLKAIKQSRGNRCGVGYLILAGLLVLLTLTLSLITFVTLNEEASSDGFYVSYFSDIVENIILIEVIVFSVCVKKRLK